MCLLLTFQEHNQSNMQHGMLFSRPLIAKMIDKSHFENSVEAFSLI